MRLLYLDDSGSAKNLSEDYLVLGGVSIFESQAQWITQELDRLATTKRQCGIPAHDPG